MRPGRRAVAGECVRSRIGAVLLDHSNFFSAGELLVATVWQSADYCWGATGILPVPAASIGDCNLSAMRGQRQGVCRADHGYWVERAATFGFRTRFRRGAAAQSIGNWGGIESSADVVVHQLQCESG